MADSIVVFVARKRLPSTRAPHEAGAASSAGELVSQLDQPLVVESARYAGSGRIELQFQDPGAFRVEFFGIGMLFGLHAILGCNRFELN